MIYFIQHKIVMKDVFYLEMNVDHSILGNQVKVESVVFIKLIVL